jgi:hypothetical protein
MEATETIIESLIREMIQKKFFSRPASSDWKESCDLWG